MAAKKIGGFGLGASLSAAKEVKTPMTFFAWVAAGILGSITTLYFAAEDIVSTQSAIIMSVLALALAVDCVCVLQWGKARLAKDPTAFTDTGQNEEE